VVDPETDRTKILETMLKLGPSTRTAIRDATGLRDPRFNPAFSKLLDGAIVACEIMRKNRRTPYERCRIADE
jgi:hypothetical protein